MAIVDLQRRSRELGRIRMGQVVSTSNGKLRPGKLDRFRVTSPSQALIEQVAKLYGGTARPWTPQGGGAPQWEVLTEATRLPVLVPPQPVSQWYESWSKGGCVRRCDGIHEIQTDSPCLCGPDPQERECKPTTRLNVVLAEVEGIGVFRLETHGYYAATELPSAAELLAASNGYISGHLALEERVVKRGGETRRFMVPTLDIGVTPAQLMAGLGAQQISGPAPRELSVPAPRAIEASAAAPIVQEPPPFDVESVRAALLTVNTLEDLRVLWPDAVAAGLQELAKDIAASFQKTNNPDAATNIGESVDRLWSRIMETVPAEWPTSKVEAEFEEFSGTPVEKADAEEMAAYLAHLGGVA